MITPFEGDKLKETAGTHIPEVNDISLFPPLKAFTDSSVPAIEGITVKNNAPAVSGTSTGSGPGIYGKSSSANAGVFDGNLQVNGNVTVTGDLILTSGADCAEQFDVAGGDTLQPGNVVIVAEDGRLSTTSEEYDRRAAGVVAGAGRFRPGITLDSKEGGGGRVPVSLIGKAFCYVDAQYGAVSVGDLLTTSNTPGYARRVSDPARAFGAVIGKALASLNEGQQMIPILVTLQ